MVKLSAAIAVASAFNSPTTLVASFSILRPVLSSQVYGSGSTMDKALHRLNVLSDPRDTMDDVPLKNAGFGGPFKAVLNRMSAARHSVVQVWARSQAKEVPVENAIMKAETNQMDDSKESIDDSNTNESLDSAQLEKLKEFVDFSPSDLENLWLEKCHLLDDRYSENVVMQMKLNISLDDFFTLFLSDDAPVSLASHHEAVGDSSVESTQWKSDTSTSGIFTKQRQLTYKHAIKIPVPMAPPDGMATKFQTVQRFGDHGICLDTETWINDVPLADCFYIADRLVVASNPEGGVSLTVRCGNCFVKKTRIKKIINAASTKAVLEFHKGYIESIRMAVDKSLASSFGK